MFDRLVPQKSVLPVNLRLSISIAGATIHPTSFHQEATVFLSDALVPFLVLFLVSLFTAPVSRPALDRFYARIHTPVNRDRVADQREVELSYANPDRFRDRLLFPGTNWEMLKPDLTDILGFFLAVVVAAVIVGIVFTVSWIRWP